MFLAYHLSPFLTTCCFVGMLEPYCSNISNPPLKTPSPDSYLRLPTTFQPALETSLTSSFQISVPMVVENQTHASFTPPIEVVLPPSVRRSGYGVPVPLEPVNIPTYYSSPMTVARWYEVPGFNQEFGLQNPKWKMLQGIPCSTLLEGVIKHTMNSILPLRVAHSQIIFLMAENTTYHAKIARLNARCDSLSTKLKATVKYCNDLAQKLQDRMHAEV
ncbi:Hypothetical protein ZOSMA_74G00990 [Zostera marina]|uniref:Uncharacterized protein n=1 Tax=Zostera marina TaxID=29655 RepID=A0A0K9NS00_ZOSMR|nr:Hypothetical protein ZOSMA_74G00990 [Zostera marina]